MAETVLPSTTPNKGKRTTGSNAVAAIGMASVTHQIAINIAMASVYVIFGLSGAKSPKRINDMLIKGATTSAARLTFEFSRLFCIIIEWGQIEWVSDPGPAYLRFNIQFPYITAFSSNTIAPSTH